MSTNLAMSCAPGTLHPSPQTMPRKPSRLRARGWHVTLTTPGAGPLRDAALEAGHAWAPLPQVIDDVAVARHAGSNLRTGEQVVTPSPR